jgi:prepilin-type N-terminal cleavage/methylation domain-containing protein
LSFIIIFDRSAGFTLLEMLFVMLIVGLLVGLTAPRFGAGIDRYESLSQKQAMEDQLRQLPRRVRLNAKTIELPRDLKMENLGDDEPVLRIPEGWTISFAPPLVISRLGACSGSTVSLQSAAMPETSSRYRLVELSCELLPESP